MAGSDNDELPRREIEARMSKGLKRALRPAQDRPAKQAPGKCAEISPRA